jgi:hypothetical protein
LTILSKPRKAAAKKFIKRVFKEKAKVTVKKLINKKIAVHIHRKPVAKKISNRVVKKTIKLRLRPVVVRAKKVIIAKKMLSVRKSNSSLNKEPSSKKMKALVKEVAKRVIVVKKAKA